MSDLLFSLKYEQWWLVRFASGVPHSGDAWSEANGQSHYELGN